MPTIQAVVKNLEEVPAELRQYYVETESGFALDVTDAAALPSVRNLKSAHDRLSAELARKQREVAEIESRLPPDDYTREKWDRLKAFEIANSDEAAELARMRREVAAKDEIIARKQAFIDKLKIEGALRAALIKAGVRPAMMRAAIALLAEQAEIDRDRVMIRTRWGRAPVRHYVENWCRAGDGRHFVDPERVRVEPARLGVEPSASSSQSTSFANLVRELKGRTK